MVTGQRWRYQSSVKKSTSRSNIAFITQSKRAREFFGKVKHLSLHLLSLFPGTSHFKMLAWLTWLNRPTLDLHTSVAHSSCNKNRILPLRVRFLRLLLVFPLRPGDITSYLRTKHKPEAKSKISLSLTQSLNLRLSLRPSLRRGKAFPFRAI